LPFFGAWGLLPLFPSRRRLLRRGEHHRHVAALHRRSLLHDRLVAERLDQALQQFEPELGPLLFASPEADGDLDLVAVGEELLGPAAADVEVVLSDPDLHPDLLHLGPRLLLARFAVSYGLLVLVLAVVHQATDRGVGVGRRLAEAQAELFGEPQGSGQLLPPDLFPVGGNPPSLGGTDVSFHAQVSDVSTSW